MQSTKENQASVSVKAIAGNKEQFTFNRTVGSIKPNQVEALLSLLSGPLQKPYVMLKALALSTHNIFEQENNELEPEQTLRGTKQSHSLNKLIYLGMFIENVIPPTNFDAGKIDEISQASSAINELGASSISSGEFLNKFTGRIAEAVSQNKFIPGEEII